jgi:thymidylate synthase
MLEALVIEKTLPDAYHAALKQLWLLGEKVPCPDYNTNQKEISMTMVVQYPIEEPMISRLFIGGPADLEQYCQEMLDGILDFEVERGNWEYTYHLRFADQLPRIVKELKRNPDSRRAVISTREEGDFALESPPCLQNMQYFIRNGELHCKVLFRSNDAVKAAFMNAFALIMLQQRIARELGVPVGTYVHRANSFHVYERDYALLRGYRNRIDVIDGHANLTFDYAGEWDELMADAQPEIAKKVQELKERKHA